MKNDGAWTIPNCLTILRIAITVALYPILLLGLHVGFIAGYVVAWATDLLDGYLARRWKLESYLGMRLDSFADWFLYASSLIWAYLLTPDLFRKHWRQWLAITVVLAIPQVIGFARFGKPVGFHLYTTRAAGWISFALFAHAFITRNPSGLLLTMVLAAAVLKSLEEALICLSVRDPYADHHASFLGYVRRRPRVHA